MKKLLLTSLTLVAVITGVTVAVAQSGGTTPAPGPVPAQGVDISGNCDEAEHAADPECQGVAGSVRDDDDADDRADDDRGRDHAEDDGIDDDGIDDISGNCDEAEHAADPECAGITGQVPDRDDDRDRVDNSGPGSVSSGDDDEFDDHDELDDDDGFDDDPHSGSDDDGHSDSGDDD